MSTKTSRSSATLSSGLVALYPDLSGRIAVVTGGSQGIGAATCRMLAANGVSVAVSGHEEVSVTQTVKALRDAGGTAIGVVADVRSADDLGRLSDQVATDLGPPDVVIAFAGGFAQYPTVLDTSEEDWRTILDTNLTGTFLTVKAFAPGMVAHRRGSIVLMSSASARVLDLPVTASYAAAKAGVRLLSQHAALELGPHGVRVNCVAPGTSASERIDQLLSRERARELAALSPLRRLGTPEDTAAMALFLASDVSDWITGATLDINGGRVMA